MPSALTNLRNPHCRKDNMIRVHAVKGGKTPDQRWKKPYRADLKRLRRKYVEGIRLAKKAGLPELVDLQAGLQTVGELELEFETCMDQHFVVLLMEAVRWLNEHFERLTCNE